MTKATLRAAIGCILTTMALVVAAKAEDPEANAYKLLEIDRRTAKWYGAASEAPVELKYAYVDRRMAFKSARNCGSMQPISAALKGSNIHPGIFRREAEKAFAMWEDVAQVRFVETRDLAKANILIGAQTQPLGRAFTNVELSETFKGLEGPQSIAQSLICFNPQVRWKVGYDGNLDVYDLLYTMAHEIGHALGLDHPGASGQLMAYRYDERLQSLQPGDIDGILRLYKPTQLAARIRRLAENEAIRQPGQDGTDSINTPNDALGLGDGRLRH